MCSFAAESRVVMMYDCFPLITSMIREAEFIVFEPLHVHINVAAEVQENTELCCCHVGTKVVSIISKSGK